MGHTHHRSTVRSVSIALALCIVAGALQMAIGPHVALLPPFSLFGVAVLLAGALGGASSAFVTTGVLCVAWWYHWLVAHPAGAPVTPWMAVQLSLMLVEGVAIALTVRQVELARATACIEKLHASELRALDAKFAAARGPDEVASIIVEHSTKAWAASAAVFMQTVDPGKLAVIAHCGAIDVSDEALTLDPAATGPISTAYRTKDAVWLEGREACMARLAEFPRAAIADLRSEAVVPLTGDNDRVLGLVDLQFRHDRRFSPKDKAQLVALCEPFARSFERAQLCAKEVAARLKLSELDALGSALSQALTRDDVAQVVVERGMAAAHADTCTLYATTEAASVLELIASKGVGQEVLSLIGTIELTSSDGQVPRVLREPCWAESPEELQDVFPSLLRMPASVSRTKALWTVPLVVGGRVTGLMGMGFFAAREFLPEDRLFVETLARHCAEALRRAERVEAELRARTMAERMKSSLNTTLRSIGDAVIATDSTGLVTFMNPVAEELTGWRDAEAQGRSLREVFRILDERTREEKEAPVDAVLRDGAVVGFTNHTLLMSKNGGRLTPIEDSGAPIRSESGDIDGVVLVFRDVSARKQEELHLNFLSEATRTLGESLDYQGTLARVAQLAVPQIADWVAVDLFEEGQAEPKRLAVMHVDPAKLQLAKEIDAKYPPVPGAERGSANVIRTGRPEIYEWISAEMLRAACRDEEHFRLSQALGLRSVMIVPLIAREQRLGAMTFATAESGRLYRDSDLAFAEELCRRCALAIDNARLYSAEQSARRSADLANQAKDEFLATVSHELRTPLNAIMGWSRILSAPVLDSAKTKRGLETIERNAVAMARLIEDILDVSRIISGKMKVEFHSVDLASIIEAAIESLRPAADAKSVHVVASLDRTVGPVLGDPTRLQQVVWNLLSNAIKFNKVEGTVEVALQRVGSSVEVRVSDTGKGIHSSFLPYVFDVFRQSESGYARGRSGLGLGLAIAKQLTELHGGHIHATSPGENRGANFVVVLPVPAVARSGVAHNGPMQRRIDSQPKFHALGALRGLRVLVVDDDEDARVLVKTVLEECGSTVVTAGTAADGLKEIEREKPDVLVSDIGMPGEDGYELIRKVRSLPNSSSARIPAAALTAYVRPEDRYRALSAGYSVHIAKPVEPAELVATIARLVGPPPQQIEKRA